MRNKKKIWISLVSIGAALLVALVVYWYAQSNSFQNDGFHFVRRLARFVTYLALWTTILGILTRVPTLRTQIEKFWPPTLIQGFVFLWSLTFCFFFLQLFLLWSGQYQNYSAIGGLLPWSDAQGYFAGGQRLIEHSSLSENFGCRRPFNHLYMASLFSFSGHNYSMLIILYTLLGVVSTSISAFFVFRVMNPFSSVLFVLASYYYFKSYVGIILSSNLGFLLGSGSLTLILFGIYKTKKVACYLGLFGLTVALCARAGPFFALPFLAIASALFVSKKRFDFKVFGLCLTSIIIAFALNAGVKKMYCSGKGMNFSNFSYTLYGLAVGGKGWRQIKIDHPEISVGSETKFAEKVYALSFEIIKEKPMLFIEGLRKGFGLYFQRYFHILPKRFQYYELLLLGLSIVFLLFYVVRRKQMKLVKLGSTLILGLFGIILSSPIVAHDGGARVFSPTKPIYCFLLALGLHFFVTLISKPNDARTQKMSAKVFAIPCVSILLLIFIAPILVVFGGTNPEERIPPKELSCPAHSELSLFRRIKGASLYIDTSHPSKGRYTRQLDLKSLIKSLENPRLVGSRNRNKFEFSRLIPPTTLFMGYNITRDEERIVSIPGIAHSEWPTTYRWLCFRFRYDDAGPRQIFYGNDPIERSDGVIDE